MSSGAWRSPASALQWGCKGRRFESDRPDQIKKKPLSISGFFFNDSEQGRPTILTVPHIFFGLLVDGIIQLIYLLEMSDEIGCNFQVFVFWEI